MLPQPSASFSLLAEFQAARDLSRRVAEGLSAEDQMMQSMPDASPVKWHLAHTTWFFETFVLVPHAPGYRVFHPAYEALFNSYYNSIGAQFPRAKRSLLSRPSVEEVRHWRAHVERGMAEFLSGAAWVEEAAFPLRLGLHHEQQHQELMLTDIKHALFQHPLQPAYRMIQAAASVPASAQRWIAYEGGLSAMGADAEEAFTFDNERPRHVTYLRPFALAARLVTNAEFAAFVDAGGYGQPELWLADAWAIHRAEGRSAPLYWEKRNGDWWHFTHSGPQPIEPNAPVAYVSHYEADAYAHWAEARLPTEAEWEHAASDAAEQEKAQTAGEGFLDLNRLAPRAASPSAHQNTPLQMFGEVWEWTASAYAAHPGFRPFPGKAAEYNGKFMSGQMVLKGGSCLTPPGHSRISYRNFFAPDARWQCSGIRLARDVA